MYTIAEVSFGEWLKRRRKSAGLTQEQLAEQVSCSTITLRKIEAEERRPSEQIVRQLAEIFSISPNEHTAFLKFARGDWKSAPNGKIEDAHWSVSTKAPPSNLPIAFTSLIGRKQDVAIVCEYLSRDGVRLVTLIGPPGIGKTRLSIEGARQSLHKFPDGVVFVALAPLDDPTLIAFTLAQTLGYVGVKNLSTSEQLREGIGDKQMLLVLDNCEHLVEGVAALASDLLSVCPHLKILTTSRESLRAPGEWQYSVPTLNVPKENSVMDLETASQFPALILFAERARAVRSDFTLNPDNLQPVASICAQLDGLPLAIELIAARVRLMSPQALLERMNDQFILSADGMRAPSARQKTLNHAIGWSYNLLSKEEQKLFARLSVFSGGFTLDAAEAMFSRTVSEKSVPDLITSLLDKSLLQRAFDSSGEPRFDMLVTIQHFALNHLRHMGKEREARNGHLAYFLDLAEQGDQEMRGHRQIEWLGRLHAMSDNFRAALEWAIETRQTELALQMVLRLNWFWYVRGDHSGARHWLAHVLEMSDTPLHSEAYAEALTDLADHAFSLDEKEAIAAARPLVEQALCIARANNDRQYIDRALAVLAGVLALERNFEAARSILEEIKARFQEAHDEWGYANAVRCLAYHSMIQEDWAAALVLNQQALTTFQKLGDKFIQSLILRYIGRAYVNLGDVTKGTAALRESIILAQQLGSKYQIAMALWRGFAEAALRDERIARAVSLISAAINVFQSIGSWEKEDDLLFENELGPCRATLGESAFAEAVTKGDAMTMERAVAYALELRDA